MAALSGRGGARTPDLTDVNPVLRFTYQRGHGLGFWGGRVHGGSMIRDLHGSFIFGRLASLIMYCVYYSIIRLM